MSRSFSDRKKQTLASQAFEQLLPCHHVMSLSAFGDLKQKQLAHCPNCQKDIAASKTVQFEDPQQLIPCFHVVEQRHLGLVDIQGCADCNTPATSHRCFKDNKSQSDTNTKLDEAITDPVSQEPLKKAHLLIPCGHSISEETLEQYKLYKHSKCPCCNSEIEASIPNNTLNAVIAAVPDDAPVMVAQLEQMKRQLKEEQDKARLEMSRREREMAQKVQVDQAQFAKEKEEAKKSRAVLEKKLEEEQEKNKASQKRAEDFYSQMRQAQQEKKDAEKKLATTEQKQVKMEETVRQLQEKLSEEIAKKESLQFQLSKKAQKAQQSEQQRQLKKQEQQIRDLTTKLEQERLEWNNLLNEINEKNIEEVNSLRKQLIELQNQSQEDKKSQEASHSLMKLASEPQSFSDPFATAQADALKAAESLKALAESQALKRTSILAVSADASKKEEKTPQAKEKKSEDLLGQYDMALAKLQHVRKLEEKKSTQVAATKAQKSFYRGYPFPTTPQEARDILDLIRIYHDEFNFDFDEYRMFQALAIEDEPAASPDRKKAEDVVLEAILTENDDILAQLLEKNVDVNSVHPISGKPLLIIAIENSCPPKIVRLLLEKKADVQQFARDDVLRNPALHYAVQLKQDHIVDPRIIVKDLIDAKANVNGANACGSTALHYAAANNPELYSLLVKLGANPDQQNNLKVTPAEVLAISAANMKKANATQELADVIRADTDPAKTERAIMLAKELIDSNADINSIDRKTCLPLLALAATQSSAQMVRLLLDNKADIQAQAQMLEDTDEAFDPSIPREGITMAKTAKDIQDRLDLIAKEKLEPVVGAFIDVLTSQLPILSAARASSSSPLKMSALSAENQMAAAAKKDKEAKSSQALVATALKAHKDAAPAPQAKTADLKAAQERIRKLSASLVKAVYHDNFKLAQTLLDSKAEVNSVDCSLNGCPVLHVAALQSTEEMVKLLLKNGADIKIQSKMYKRALEEKKAPTTYTLPYDPEGTQIQLNVIRKFHLESMFTEETVQALCTIANPPSSSADYITRTRTTP